MHLSLFHSSPGNPTFWVSQQTCNIDSKSWCMLWAHMILLAYLHSIVIVFYESMYASTLCWDFMESSQHNFMRLEIELSKSNQHKYLFLA